MSNAIERHDHVVSTCKVLLDIACNPSRSSSSRPHQRSEQLFHAERERTHRLFSWKWACMPHVVFLETKKKKKNETKQKNVFVVISTLKVEMKPLGLRGQVAGTSHTSTRPIDFSFVVLVPDKKTHKKTKKQKTKKNSAGVFSYLIAYLIEGSVIYILVLKSFCPNIGNSCLIDMTRGCRG